MSFLKKAVKKVKKAVKKSSNFVAEQATKVAVITEGATNAVSDLVKDVPVVNDIARYAGDAGAWGTTVGIATTAAPALVGAGSDSASLKTLMSIEKQTRRGAAIAGATVAAAFAAPALLAAAPKAIGTIGSAAAAIGAVKNVVGTSVEESAGPVAEYTSTPEQPQSSGALKTIVPLAVAGLGALLLN